MLQISKYLREGQLMKESRLYASSGTTRWEDVFGTAKEKVEKKTENEKTIDSGYFSKPSGKSADNPPSSAVQSAVSSASSPSANMSSTRVPLSAYGNLTSLGLKIEAKQIEYERYKKTNDVEKVLQAKNEYDVSKITNPFHHVKTNNPFNGDLRAAFRELYGDWDGKSEDGKGFAYVDKYGFSHVADNFFSAMIYSMDGKVYNYEGHHVGGYAVNAQGHRVALLGLDNSVLYGNFQNGDSVNTLSSPVLAKRDLEKEPLTPSEQSARDAVSYAKLPLFDLSRMASFRDKEIREVGRADQ